MVDRRCILAPVHGTFPTSTSTSHPTFIIVDSGAAESILNDKSTDLGPVNKPYTYEVAGGLTFTPQRLGCTRLLINTERSSSSSPLILDVSGSWSDHNGPILLSVNHPALTDIHLKCQAPSARIHGALVQLVKHRHVWGFWAAQTPPPPSLCSSL